MALPQYNIKGRYFCNTQGRYDHHFAQVLTPSLQYIQLSYMFVSNNIHLLHVSLDISNTLVDMYMKLRKHLGFDI